MKHILLLLSVLLLISSCKTQTYPMANVTYQSVSNGIISMRCTGLGANKEKAVNDAEKNALMVLLFRGLPGSGQESPLLSIDEDACKAQHPDYLNRLFGNSMRYKSFIISSVPVGPLQKQGRRNKSLASDVKVNIKSLRLDLEKQGLVRRFGY